MAQASAGDGSDLAPNSRYYVAVLVLVIQAGASALPRRGQSIFLADQNGEQVPKRQKLLGGQTFPQAPQLSSSRPRFLQPPAQHVLLSTELQHSPLQHSPVSNGPVHPAHPPQWSLSDLVSTHEPSQFVSPFWHRRRH